MSTELPTWDQMSDRDRSVAYHHVAQRKAFERQWKRRKGVAAYVIQHYPARYVDHPDLVALTSREACRHAVKVVGTPAALRKRIGGEECQRLTSLYLDVMEERRWQRVARVAADGSPGSPMGPARHHSTRRRTRAEGAPPEHPRPRGGVMADQREAMLARRRELIAANPDITEARDLAPLMGDLEREYWEWCLERFLAKEDALSSGNPRTFHLQREEDVTGVSGSGRVADGVLWPDGTATVKWRGEYASEVCWLGGIDAVERVHGHDGRTIIVWHDVPAASGDTGPVTP